MKKNGFISTSLIYTFFIVFLLMMIFLLNSYSRVRFLLEEFKYDIKESFANESIADVNLYFVIYDSTTGGYEITNEMPSFGYSYDSEFSYCKNGSKITYINNHISVTANRKDTCYAYFQETNSDIKLNIYTKENKDSKRVYVKRIPESNYIFDNYECSNGATLEFDEETRKFTIESDKKTVCDVEFVKQNYDIILNLYKESASGSYTHEIDGVEKRFEKVTEAPGLNYTFHSYICKNNSTVVYKNGEIFVNSIDKDECDVYFVGGTDKVEIIIMQETNGGVSGYTTGKTYSRVYQVPGTGFAYVGYICDDKNATVKYENGTFFGENDTQTICRVYFNKFNTENALINYYLETTSGNYEKVTSVPELGYIYSHGSCKNNSAFKVNSNYVEVMVTTSDEVCNFYYNHVNSDIQVLVYVLNRSTGKYELGDIPIIGYEMFGEGCTNDASIEYKNSKLVVTSEKPTVCTVYFR